MGSIVEVIDITELLDQRHIGRLIGKGGSNLRAIERITKVRISTLPLSLEILWLLDFQRITTDDVLTDCPDWHAGYGIFSPVIAAAASPLSASSRHVQSSLSK